MERAALLFDDAQVNESPNRVMPPRQNRRANEDAVIGNLAVSVERVEALVLQLSDRLKEMEKALTSLIAKDSKREWYTIREVAGMLHRDEYTVREWARLGRINANKLESGRGDKGEWRVAHEEVIRIQNEGLLPDVRLSRSGHRESRRCPRPGVRSSTSD